MSEFLRKRAGAKISIVLLSIFLFLFLFSTVAFAETYQYGDVNEDGNINVLDVVLIVKHVLELDLLEGEPERLADINGDRNIDVQDVTLAMQLSLGLIDDIVDTLIADGDFETLVAAVVEAELVDALKADGPFTVFAPTDEAFADLLDDLGITVEDLLDLDNLADILLYHVVEGDFRARDFIDDAPVELETLQGEKIKITVDNGKVFVNDSEVTDANIVASNGVIHAIDGVLLPLPDKLEVVSVKATDKKTITVMFNKPVENPNDAEIIVKLGTSTVPVSFITTSWVDPFDKVELKRSVDYDPGNYTVTILGLGLDQVHYTLTIEPERVGKIVITSSNLVIADPLNPYTASGHYRVYNQYGEDITTKPLAANLTWTSSLGNVADVYDDNKGKVTVDKWIWIPGNAFTTDDILTLTAIDPSSGVAVTRTVGVVDTLVIEDFEFGEVTPLPAPRERVEVGWNPAARILIAKALDEDGINRITFGELQGQITLVSSDPLVELHLADKDYGYHNDKQAAIYVDTSDNTLTARTITITVVINATGETFSMLLQIHEQAYADDVKIGDIENGKAAGDSSDVIAAGDENIYLPLTVWDQFGVEREPWQVAADYLNGKFSFESSNISVIHSDHISIETWHASPYRGYLKIASVGVEGYTNIKVTVVDSGKYDIKEVIVSAPRRLAEIYLPADMVTLEPPYFKMVQGSTRSFEFSYKDQYGDSYEAVVADHDNYQVDVSIDLYSGDPGALSLAPIDEETVTNAQTDNWYTLTASDTLAGVSKIKGVLQYRETIFEPFIDLYEAKTYIEVVEAVPGTLENASVSNLEGNESGQVQEFKFTLEGQLLLNERVEITIADSKGVEYSTDPADWSVTVGSMTVTDVSAVTDPVITLRATANIPTGTEITLVGEQVSTLTVESATVDVEFERMDSNETDSATFNVGAGGPYVVSVADDAGAAQGGAKATLTTDNGVADMAIIWTAVNIGLAGNDITITYAHNQPDEGDVTVTNGNIVITIDDGTTTAADIVGYVAGDAAASALVEGVADGDGSGAPQAMPETSLTGGEDIILLVTWSEDITGDTLSAFTLEGVAVTIASSAANLTTLTWNDVALDPVADGDGLSISAGAVEDPDGNGNAAVTLTRVAVDDWQ